jgi:hypothetical protein
LKNRTKKILIILLFLIHTTFAQTLYEFDLHYGFGASELFFNNVPGIAISIYPIKNFGFSAGLQYSLRGQTKTSEIIDSTNTIDSEGDSLIFRYSIGEYKEKLSGRILQVPILLKYSNDSYYAAAGIKIGAVQKASASVNYSELNTKGYYPKYNLTLSAPAYQGFGTQEDSSFKTEVSSKNLIMLAMESGIKLKLNNNLALLAGIFADYSFNKGFNRNLKPTIDRIEKENSKGASIVANDRWKSWQPWSIGLAIKFSLATGHQNTQEKTPAKPVVEKQNEDSLKNHSITVKANIPPPPAILPPKAPPTPTDSVQQENASIISDLPEFLLNRKADFVFFYPESRANPTDSLHSALTSQIAHTLREKPSLQLHCVGYSEKLLSESVAYETALQRTLRIRSNLTRFYGIEEKRIFIYSQGLRNIEYRRTECFVLDVPP